MTITIYWGVRNYSDRRILQNLSEATHTESYSNIVFNVNDHIETTLTINTPTADFPSFLIAEDTDGTITQWWVVSAVRTRKNQQVLALRRDFLDEKYSELQGLPFLTDRASDLTNLPWAKYLKTTNLSQIKTGEQLLRDYPNRYGYIVGYVDKTKIFQASEDSAVSEKITISTSINANSYDYYYQGESISGWELYGAKRRGALNIDFDIHYLFYNSLSAEREYLNISDGLFTSLVYDTDEYSGVSFEGDVSSSMEPYTSAVVNATWRAMTEAMGQVQSVITSDSGTPKLGDLSEYDGKVLAFEDSNGNLTRYRITINESKISYYDNADLSGDALDTFIADLKTQKYGSNSPFVAMTTNTGWAKVTAYYTRQSLVLTQIEDKTISADLMSDHIHTANAVYDVFVIPLGGTYTLAGSDSTKVINWAWSYQQNKLMAWITYFSTELGSNLYDIQLLPYCPIDFSHIIYTPENGSGNSAVDNGYRFSIIKYGDDDLSALIWLDSCEFTKQLSQSMSIPEDNTEARIYNEEHLTRLVGPNFASMFELDLVKNHGLSGFNVYGALKPYNPYIRVAPVFSGIYGTDYQDGRGLILSGDFSLDRITDAWTTYKLQNKNYELIFNRQIQSLDLRNTLQDRLDRQSAVQEYLGVASGTLQGASSGAFTGGAIGGPVGAVVGGAVGGAASLGGGIADIVVNTGNRKLQKAIRDDVRQASIDNFEYQLGNIQAAPNTLTKVSTFSPDFRIYPLIEFYECTAEEDKNLRQAIRWNGIDVNAITQLAAFSSGYVKGSILRFGNLGLNADEAKEINSELEQGVYLS